MEEYCYASTPLVLGTPAELSIVTASRSATPSDLNADSALWWSFDPCRLCTCSVMRLACAKLSSTWCSISVDNEPNISLHLNIISPIIYYR